MRYLMLLVALVASLLTADAAHAQNVQCPIMLPISVAADTELVAGASGKRVYVCAVVLFAGTAEIINFVEGSGSVCATGKTAVVGSSTDANGMSLATNGSVQIQGQNPLFWTSTSGNSLCLTLSGTNRVAGFISYEQK